MTSRRLLDPATKLLLDAADYIEKHGWCQNTARDEATGKVCILGALSMVGQLDDNIHNYNAATYKLKTYLGHSEISFWNRTIACWNDKLGQTKDKVIAVLRAAALS